MYSGTLYCGHHWDPCNCPDFMGVLNSGVVLYRIATIGTNEIVRGVRIEEFHCITDVAIYILQLNLR